MAEIASLFVTKLYRAALEEAPALNADLLKACRAIAADDGAGQAWSRAHGYKGYTSYGSLNDLPLRDPSFAALKKALGEVEKLLYMEDRLHERVIRPALVVVSTGRPTAPAGEAAPAA